MTAAKNMDSASMGRAYANKVSMAYIVALTHAAVGLTVMDMDCAKTWLTMKTDLNTNAYVILDGPAIIAKFLRKWSVKTE